MVSTATINDSRRLGVDFRDILYTCQLIIQQNDMELYKKWYDRMKIVLIRYVLKMIHKKFISNLVRFIIHKCCFNMSFSLERFALATLIEGGEWK